MPLKVSIVIEVFPHITNLGEQLIMI